MRRILPKVLNGIGSTLRLQFFSKFNFIKTTNNFGNTYGCKGRQLYSQNVHGYHMVNLFGELHVRFGDPSEK